MITKIKNLVKKINTVEWIILGIAVFALVVGLGRCQGNKHGGQHKADKHEAKASVEKAAATTEAK